jgi:hypothetical protein
MIYWFAVVFWLCKNSQKHEILQRFNYLTFLLPFLVVIEIFNEIQFEEFLLVIPENYFPSESQAAVKKIFSNHFPSHFITQLATASGCLFTFSIINASE